MQENLIKEYNTLVRPVSKNSDQLVVKFGIKLTQILDVDEKNQVLITNVWLKHVNYFFCHEHICKKQCFYIFLL